MPPGKGRNRGPTKPAPVTHVFPVTVFLSMTLSRLRTKFLVNVPS